MTLVLLQVALWIDYCTHRLMQQSSGHGLQKVATSFPVNHAEPDHANFGAQRPVVLHPSFILQHAQRNASI
jgi:hypothetical protein